MVASLGPDDHVVLVRANLSPLRKDRLLRQTTQVDELPVLVDLCKSSSICLSDCNKLATIARYPAPRGRSFTSKGAQISVTFEVVVVNLVMSVQIHTPLAD